MKKKILFLLEAFDKGGIEKVTLDIVNHLDPEKYDITVQTFWYGGHCQSLVREEVKVLPFFFKRYVPGVIRLIQYLPPKWLYRLFVKGRYDVEIAASDGGAAKVISGSSNKKAKKICWVHMDVVERGSQLKEFQDPVSAGEIYGKFDLIVPVSQSCKEKFIQKFGDGYPLEVRRNPMPVKEILEKADAASVDLPKDRTNFVCLGRLVEQKGFDRLLEVCKRLRDEGAPAFHVTVLGEGPLRQQLEEQRRQLGLCDTVDLPGYCDNPYPWLRAADAFLLTSRDEAFSLVVGESLIVGTPAVATDCSGVAEWLEGGRGVITENSVDGILDGMRSVLERPELLRECRSRLSQLQLSFEQALSEFEDIF